MKKAIFIIPYFGKFNNYFQLFLNSCKYNDDFSWLIFTDDRRKYNYPSNVSVKYMEINELIKIIKNKFIHEKIEFEKPYKLCDYKPMYGYIFEEYIKEYDYWGFCDIDLIFGKINHFINLNDLEQFDKIGFLGHFTLFKNTKQNNRIFMRSDIYKKVLGSNKNFKFDEEFEDSINNIYIRQNKKILFDEFYADIYTKSSNFKITHYDIKKNIYITDKKDNSIFVWEKGNLIKLIQRKKEVIKQEYMYIHLQKRPMKVNIALNTNCYKIIPNSFDYIETNELKKIKKKHFNLHYFKIRAKNLRIKIKKRILEE